MIIEGTAGRVAPRRRRLARLAQGRAADPRFAHLAAREAAMAIAKSARIHPTAVIDPQAELDEEVQVGPFVVIDGPCHVGPGCVLKAGAHLMGPLTMGAGNVVHSYAVLGDTPQHLKYTGEPSSVE